MVNSGYNLNYVILLAYIASQMWLLLRILPCAMGRYIPEEDVNWKNFTLLSEIVSYLFSPSINDGDCAYVKV